MLIFQNISVQRGNNFLLNNASASINPKQKVGLVGKNGTGKSSLFALILGELTTESGEMIIPKEWSIAWVKQETPSVDINIVDYVLQGDKEYTELQQELIVVNQQNDGDKIAQIHAKLDTIDAWTIKSRAGALLHGLGFKQNQLDNKVTDFSGGWRMRLNLAQALICRSDLLLLDEPTNHLDLDAVLWLENWLKQYDGTLILISHDRDFIDSIVNKIIHIENHQLNEYTGNYSNFEQMRATKIAQHQALYKQQQQKVEHLEKFITKFKAKASKAKQAQSRIKQLERMSLIAPAHVDSPFHFSFKNPTYMPNPLLSMKDVSCGYANKTILNSIKLNLVPGSRIGILGKNGAGKSTLIKLLANQLDNFTGSLTHAKELKIGYFAQHQLDTLRKEHNAIWHLTNLDKDITEQQARNYLGGFDFIGDKVYQPVQFFSGGEKARLVLALIVWQAPNLLLLDEPTNHLDLEMRQALTEALIDYQGSLVIISHDRYLLSNTVDEFYLVADQKVAPFDGSVEDYQIWLQLQDKQELKENDIDIVQNEFIDKKQQKKIEAELRQKIYPIKQKADKVEIKINQLTEQLSKIEIELTDNSLYQTENKNILTETLSKQQQLKNQLSELELEWLDLLEQIESYTN